MNKTFMILLTISLIAFSGSTSVISNDLEKDSIVTLERKKLPTNWSIEKTITVPEKDLSNFSNRLGGNIISLVNYILKADGKTFQINIIQSDNENEAKKVYSSLLSMKSVNFVKLKGSYVVEYVMNTNIEKDVMERVKKANEILGLKN